jgi:hypothetical protein
MDSKPRTVATAGGCAARPLLANKEAARAAGETMRNGHRGRMNDGRGVLRRTFCEKAGRTRCVRREDQKNRSRRFRYGATTRRGLRSRQNRVVSSFSMKSDRRPPISRRGKNSWMGTFNTSARNMRSLSSTKRSRAFRSLKRCCG